MSCWLALSPLEVRGSLITSTIRWCTCRPGSRPANKAHRKIAQAPRLRPSKVARLRIRSEWTSSYSEKPGVNGPFGALDRIQRVYPGLGIKRIGIASPRDEREYRVMT